MRKRLFFLLLAFVLTGFVGCKLKNDQDDQITPVLATETPSPQIGVDLATVTPAKLTPVTLTPMAPPEPSPTPTVTPVIYVVAEGDTLFGIAVDHKTSVEEILALNPGIQPELLQIGLELIVPPKPTAEAPLAADTAQVTQLAIQGLRAYPTVTGGLWVLGEVHNPGGQAVENVQVEIRLVNENGSELAVVHSWVVPGIIPTNGSAPFGKLILPVPAGDAVPLATVIAGNVVADLGNRYLDLAVSDAEVTIVGSHYMVGGHLRNSGQVTVGQISLVTTLYDNTGCVAGFHELLLEAPLDPEESVPFEFEVLPPGSPVTGQAFAVMGLTMLQPES